MDKRTDFIKKLTTLTENGLPIHIAQALLRDAAGSDANWHMRRMGIPSRVASEMDRVVGQAYQAILGVGDLTVAQAKQLFIPMREGGFGLASAELQAEPAMMVTWASCAARFTARIGLGCIDDLSAEISGLRSALSQLQAVRREAGEDPNDLTRLGSTATSQRALALPRQQSHQRPARPHWSQQQSDRAQLRSPARGQIAVMQIRVRPRKPMQKQETRRNRVRSRPGQGRQTADDVPVRARSPRGHTALRDEIANIGRRTRLCADIGVLVDHPAIDPENGARMDVRISKTGSQNADELIDVQVTSPFCVEAAGLVCKAATIAESKKRTKYRPAVVTPSILETHGRMGPPSKRSWPRLPQKISKPGPPGCRKP